MPKTCNHPTCNWPVWGKGYCKSHQYLRIDLKEKPKPVKEFKPLRKSSIKYGKQLTIYHRGLPGWKLKNSVCAVPGCGKPTVDCHHQIGRGIHLNNDKYKIPLCEIHHPICKEDPSKAEELGIILTRTISRKYEYD